MRYNGCMKLGLIEKQCLKTYFMCDRLCGADKRGRKKLFDTLKDIYGLESSELEAAFLVSERENILAAVNLEAYERIRRLVEFSNLSGVESPLNADELEVLDLKADGMRSAIEKELVHKDAIPAGGLSLLNRLKIRAKEENIHALNAMGLFLLTGIFGEKDEKAGQWMIRKTAKWNSIEGLLLTLKYYEPKREKYLARLYTVCYQVAEEALWQVVRKKYNAKAPKEFDDEALLLEKLFSAHESFDRNKYMSTHVRILSSTFLSLEDKKRILFSKNTEILSRISDLPLHYDVEKSRVLDAQCVDQHISDPALNAYMKRILADSFDARKIFPIITGNQELLKSVKATLLDALKTFTVEVINAQYLNERDLDKSADNIFISRITYNKDTRTVFIIENLDKLGNFAAAVIGEFLDPNYRKIRLAPMNVTIDISSCRFIGLATSVPMWMTDLPIEQFAKASQKAGFGGE